MTIKVPILGRTLSTSEIFGSMRQQGKQRNLMANGQQFLFKTSSQNKTIQTYRPMTKSLEGKETFLRVRCLTPPSFPPLPVLCSGSIRPLHCGLGPTSRAPAAETPLPSQKYPRVLRTEPELASFTSLQTAAPSQPQRCPNRPIARWPAKHHTSCDYCQPTHFTSWRPALL